MGKLQVASQKGWLKGIRYGECERNHAVNNGGFAVDGCKEFIASDENGDSALKCSCCGCHRNFHRVVEETDQESFAVEEQKEKKRRKLKSKVWDDFTKSVDKDGKEWAVCTHCEEKFDGSSKKGTTHLKNHLVSKICQNKRKRDDDDDENADILTQTRDLATPVLMKEKSSVIDLIKLSFDEYGRHTKFWDPSVLNSRKDEILQVYQKEKEKLDEFLNKLSCRFSLCIVNVYRLLLMVHFIDDSWERQSKIISIITSENYIEETKKSCLDWKIDRNICSIQHDDCMTTDDEEIIESWFNQRGSLPFVGVGLDYKGFKNKIKLFANHIRGIYGLWEFVDYGNKISKTMCKEFICEPYVYGLYDCLDLALGLKEPFSDLEKLNSYFISTPTFEHWKVLKNFVDSLSWDYCSSITTKVVDILKLFRFHSGEDCQVCKDASYKKLVDKIQVYLVVVILDPRFKMDIIQRCYKEIHGNDADSYFEKTLKDFREVYNEYAKDSSEYYKMMDAMGRPCTSSTKSELDLYLYHLKVPAVENFDILAWWRGNAHFYPTLSRMARDYLAIPIIIDSPLMRKVYYIRYCSEIEDGIKSALIYLIGNK